jgi:hypothetical protein
MAVRPGKRVIDYNLPENITLGDIRQIVNETLTLSDSAHVDLPRTAGQRDAEHTRFVITEDWPLKDE